jgi:hypothetical protein
VTPVEGSVTKTGKKQAEQGVKQASGGNKLRFIEKAS